MAAPRLALLAGLLAALECQHGQALRVSPGPREPLEEPAEVGLEERFPMSLSMEEMSFSTEELSESVKDFLAHMPEDLSHPPRQSEGQHVRDTSRALECLRKATPSLDARYPADAERHVEEIRNALLPWNSRPFIESCHVEDLWTISFAHTWFDRADKTRRLSEYFGPYIPIFTKWVFPWLHNCCNMSSPDCHRCGKLKYPDGMIEALRGVLRKDVLYVTASANDEGIVSKNEFLMSEFPNILVFSAGGYGHVPVPLQNTGTDRPETFGLDACIRRFDELDVRKHFADNRVPLSERQYFVSFVGTIGHAPHRMREEMNKTVQRWAADHGLADKVVFYRGRHRQDWNNIMYTSRFSLVPRGFGRTSFHLAETLHRGLIPIFIYSDVPWIPYPKLFEEVGFATTVAELPRLLSQLLSMSDQEVEERESRAKKLGESHFSAYPVMQQMSRFMTGGNTDLVCQGLPQTIRDEDKAYPPPRKF